MPDRSLDALCLAAPFSSHDAPITGKSSTGGCHDPDVPPRPREWGVPSGLHQRLPFPPIEQGTLAPPQWSWCNDGDRPTSSLAHLLDCECFRDHERPSGDLYPANPRSGRHRTQTLQPVSLRVPYDTLLWSSPGHVIAWPFECLQYGSYFVSPWHTSMTSIYHSVNLIANWN